MPKEQGYDYLIKLLIVGDSGVGKTNMLLRFCSDNFMNSHLTTIGIDFKTKTVDIDGKKVRMQIWDTAGQERFRTITQTYYRGAMGIFLTYAVDDRESFENIQQWMRQIKANSANNIIIILIGNKCDSSKRVVSYEEGQQFAKQIDAPFYETSAKTSQNIEECFLAMAKEVKQCISMENQITIMSYTGSRIQKKNTPEQSAQKKKCC